ncbi:hypothetical protein N9Z27_01455 [Alphaproteobacteria bacterium]|nr:hypothetical protein [Alphaproteobacteria bacterium]
MEQHEVSGFSQSSAGEAMAAVLSAAGSAGSGAHSVHVLIVGLSKTGGGWKATAVVVIEPKFKPDVENAQDLEHDDVLVDGAKKEKRRSLEDARFVKEELGFKEVYEEEKAAAIWHLWMDIDLEVFYYSMVRKPENAYVHFLPKGALWDQATKHFPDMELYEAAHAKATDEPIKRHYEPAPKAKRDLADELDLGLGGSGSGSGSADAA